MAFDSRTRIQLGLAAVLLAGTGAAAGVALADRSPRPAIAAPVVAGPAAVFAPSVRPVSNLADMVEAVGPSVVQIQVKSDTGAMQRMGYGDDAGTFDDRLRGLFGDAFGGSAPRQFREVPRQGSLGSGFIVDAAGVIVTNNHVVGDADRVTVQLSDGREFKASVLGRDRQTDLAVVRIDNPGAARFTPIAWGDSDRTRVGDSVFAVGSPFGLGNTVTSGIVSARGREIGAGPYDDFLQVDAAINSGNSGGPLFDARGRVVGVNTAIFSPSGGNVGIGFAIPAYMAQRVAQQIVANGRVARGRIGVALQSITPDVARGLGLDDTKGALIAQIDAAGTAARAGLRPGDVVRGIAGQPVDDSRDLARAVADAKIGTRLPVAVLRDGKRLNLEVTIGGEAA